VEARKDRHGDNAQGNVEAVDGKRRMKLTQAQSKELREKYGIGDAFDALEDLEAAMELLAIAHPSPYAHLCIDPSCPVAEALRKWREG
jgi:hypothetical protein